MATEVVEELRYKIRTFSVNLESQEEVYCDNKSVITYCIVLLSVLNKRPIVICYHRVRKAQDAGTLRVVLIPGEYNLARLFTNTKM